MEHRAGSIQESEQQRQGEQKKSRKKLSQNVACCLFILFILIAFSIFASLLTISALPKFETKSGQVELKNVSEGLNSFGVIKIDGNVSKVELTLIPQPFYDDVQVNISTSSTLPPLSFTTLKQNLHISPYLTKGHYRTGCNILSFEEPIYLQHGSSLKYNITSSNHDVINKLCYFNNASDYIKFLANYTFEYDSQFCFNISGTNAIVDITIKEASPYYVAIDIGNNNTNISVDITAIRSYYNIKILHGLSSHCSLNESYIFSCIIKICDGYLCDTTKNRYVIIETSGSHHDIVLKYDAHSTFHFKSKVRLILFSCTVILELIAVAAALTMVYKLCKRSGPQTKPKCTCKGVIIAAVMLFLLSFHLIAIAFATINTYDWLVSSTRLVGNKYPVLLMNSQRFNKSVANVEITLSFPSADSVSVYKVPCNSLKTSSTKLGPKLVVTNLLTNQNSRTGFNFDNIPLNLAPGSTVTYSIASTLPLDSSSCISLVFMNSAEAYDEFLYIQTKFTNYVFRSDCLTNGVTTVISFPVKDEQNDYYVGIESNIGNETNTDIITVSAEVSVVQVYYNLSNTEVYTSLSVNRTSCIVRMCETILCLDPHHVCVLVNSTSFNFISYSSHPDITTITSTSRVFGFLAIICAFFLTLFISSVSFGYCIKKKDAVRRKILSNRKGSIFLSIFIGIMIFEGVFIPIILSCSIKFYGKTWINNTKDFVLVNLHQTGSIKWVDTHDIGFSVETDSANSSDISLYTVSCSEVVPITLANKSKIECKNFRSSCVLNESIYLVKVEENYVNYNISLFSNISGLLFRISTFDDYEQYENFLAKKPYTPLQSSLFYGNETFNFNFSNIDMKQKAAYYHFVLHPAFETDVYTQYYYSSSVQMESSISHYKLNNNHRPHCNITKNSTSICRSSKEDNICVVARANMLTKPVLLVATTTNAPLAIFVAVVPALVVIIFVGLVIIVFAFIVQRKSRSKGYQSLPTRSFKDGELPKGQSTRQDDSEEQPGSERELARDSQQSDELATDDELAKEHDESAKKDDQTNKLKGVHVAGKKSFLIQNNLPQLLNWKEYGLRITVPEGAVSPSETIRVSITALVGGEFILPEDSELVSVVYTITVSKPLLKPVLLEIQHCVSIETPSQANYLSFVTSSNDQSPFEFQSVDKGSFPVGGRYGSIHISEFSLWGIIETIKGLILPASRLCFAQPLYENKRLGREWQLMFLFGRDLNAVKMYMEKENEFNRSKSDKELFFQFESSDGCIEIHTNTENCSEGWSIRPHQENPTQVSQSIIDMYGRMNPPCFPHCRFTITATPGSTTVNPEFKHPVTFRGTVSINTVFNIVLTMGDHLIQHSATRSSSSEQSPEKIFRRHFHDFYRLIKPDNISAIALELFAKELITEDSFIACTNDGRPMDQRALSLLNPLRVTIGQPHVLTKLIEVLKNNQVFRFLAEELESEI